TDAPPGPQVRSTHRCLRCAEERGAQPDHLQHRERPPQRKHVGRQEPDAMTNEKETAMPQQVDDLPILTEAKAKVEKDNNVRELIDGRVALYGEPVECFERIAQV